MMLWAAFLNAFQHIGLSFPWPAKLPVLAYLHFGKCMEGWQGSDFGFSNSL